MPQKSDRDDNADFQGPAAAMRSEQAAARVATGADAAFERDAILDPEALARQIARLEVELEATRAKLREFEFYALIDPLTELLNRRGLEREIARADAYIQRYGGRAVLAFIDLDGFKAVNDRHGHAAGDALLQAIAFVIRRNVRASDSIARLGGDEFALILWNLSDDEATAKVAMLEHAIAETVIEWEGTPISVHASAGTASLAHEPFVALARADAAMYRRKRARRQAGRHLPTVKR